MSMWGGYGGYLGAPAGWPFNWPTTIQESIFVTGNTNVWAAKPITTLWSTIVSDYTWS